MAASRSAENSKLMLEADGVHVADIEKIRRAQIGREILFLDFEAHFPGIVVAFFVIIHGHGEAVRFRKFARDALAQVGRKRSDAAFARRIISQKSDLANCRTHLHRCSYSLRESDLSFRSG